MFLGIYVVTYIGSYVATVQVTYKFNTTHMEHMCGTHVQHRCKKFVALILNDYKMQCHAWTRNTLVYDLMNAHMLGFVDCHYSTLSLY